MIASASHPARARMLSGLLGMMLLQAGCSARPREVVAPVVSGIADPSTETVEFQLATPSSVPAGRHGAGLAYDRERGESVLFGGYASSGSMADTWVWNGSTWTDATPMGTDPSPAARTAAAMAYDAARKQVVLFGGATSGVVFSDFWHWDGTTWTDFATTVSVLPPPRASATMVYDEARGRIVLYGGYDGTKYLDDVWEWDGSSWSGPFTPSTRPPARGGAVMAYDAQRHVAVLFGGYDGNTYLNDTWEWNGTTWNHPSGGATLPPGRSAPSMAYDGARGRILLFGGMTAIGDTNDLWEYGPNGWFSRFTLQSPSVRHGMAATFHEGDGTVLLFGGIGTAANPSDETYTLTIKGPYGSPCVSDLACTVGRCADGFCCNAACNGMCESCSVAGTEGACTVLTPLACMGLDAGVDGGGGDASAGPFVPGPSGAFASCTVGTAGAGGASWATPLLVLLALVARRLRSRSIAVVVVSVTLALGVSSASAQAGAAAPSADEIGRAHFELGERLYAAGQFVDAAREFELAYETSHRPELLYNAYLAHRDAGQLPQARAALDGYIARAEGADTPMMRERLATLDAQIAQQRELERLRQTGSEPVTGADSGARDEPTDAGATVSSSTEPSSNRGRRTAAIALLGVAGASAVVAVASVIGVRHQDERASAYCGAAVSAPSADLCTPSPELDAIVAREHALRATGWTAIGLGASAAVVGTVLALPSRSRDRHATLEARCGLGGCSVGARGSF